MRQDQRVALRTRYGFRCAYCGVSEADVGAELTVDHLQPRASGGTDEPDNWIITHFVGTRCHACNEFKGDYWQPHSSQRILHPLHENLDNHLAESPDGTLQALTETGAFHIEKLHLNRSGLVAHRRYRRLIQSVAQSQATLWQRIESLEQRVDELVSEVEGSRRSEPDQ